MNTYFQRWMKFVIFALIFTLLMSIMPITSGEAESSQAKPVKLKVVLLPYLSFAPFFIAQEEGYFTEQGLELEFVKMSEGTGALPLLIQGELDVATGTIGINMLNAITRGGTVKIVADKGHLDPDGCPADGILIRRTLLDSGEAVDAALLRGKRISLNPISSDGYYVEKALNTLGLTVEDLKIEELLIPPMRAEALKSGGMDIVHASEPWITRILKTGHGVLWMPAKTVVPNFQYAVTVYGPTLLEKNREAGQKFMVAYLKAIRQYNQGKTERNVDILARYTGVEPELLQEVCWPALWNDAHINAESVLDFQRWGMEKGMLDTLVTEEQFWDPSFIEYANEELQSSAK